MRKLTDSDMTNIAGSTVSGHHVEGVRIKRGEFIDSDHYGYILGRNPSGHYVTWQFHLDEREKPAVYWGHYYMEDRDAALNDFNTRDLPGALTKVPGSSQSYKVMVTETLQKVITVVADSPEEAEQIVSDRWHDCKHVLTADDFAEIEFTIVPADGQATPEGGD